jgi:hypothetical protein
VSTAYMGKGLEEGIALEQWRTLHKVMQNKETLGARSFGGNFAKSLGRGSTRQVSTKPTGCAPREKPTKGHRRQTYLSMAYRCARRGTRMRPKRPEAPIP